VKHSRHNEPAPPLDRGTLDRLALSYVTRYATTRAKLRAYLDRKIKARGWAEADAPDSQEIADRMAKLGLIDDQAFALAREASLRRRGLGQRRLGAVLKAAGIEEEDAASARQAAQDHAWAAALRFAERKRIGRFALAEPDRPTRARHFAMLMRAGHPPDIARRLIESEADDPEGDGDL
jgi:regulatory protein